MAKVADDIVHIISEYCLISDFIDVDEYYRNVSINRASRVITKYFRKWITLKNTPCHTSNNNNTVCLHMVRLRFNEFGDKHMKDMLVVEFARMKFDNIFYMLDNGLYDPEDIDEDSDMCQMMIVDILHDCFNEVEFDLAYIDNFLMSNAIEFNCNVDENGIHELINIAIHAFIKALEIVQYIMCKWSCDSICNAIERLSNNSHHMITFALD